MFQSVLVFLASPQNLARCELPIEKRLPCMATRAKSVAPADRDEGRDEVSTAGPGEGSGEDVMIWLTVFGNALGFLLLMAGLWLVLRLAETLLA